MNPKIEIHNEETMLRFTLSGVNVSLANSLRRVLLSEIPLVVFRTSPSTRNKCKIITNTTRFNNEILKQRLSCIPIHIKNIGEIELDKYFMEVEVENTTDTIKYVTTKDFVIKNKSTGEKVHESELDKEHVFPSNDYTGHWIDFVRLRPKISEEIPGEKIHLICDFEIGNAKEDGMFNAVSTCAYKFTDDDDGQDRALVIKRKK
jgi:hypothetical protein